MFKSPITVSQLTTIIKELIEDEPLLRDVVVKGEISNFKNHNSGHLYFTLKDNQSVIKVVMFKYNAKHLKFMPQDGQQVIITGYVGVYQEGGSYQLYASSLHSIGEGDLTLAFNQLKEKLEKEGLFSPIHKKNPPQFPRKIGVVTGDNSAALRDILITLKRRNPLVEVVVATCLVQGAYAKNDIVSKLEVLGSRTDIDLIILARGGGSLEDLWPFNEEEVARAIFNCPIPIITGIGHETDFTIADFVADKRAATPTAAAQQAVLDLQELNQQLDIYESSLKNLLKKNLSRQKERLMELSSRIVLQRPLTILNPFYQNLDSLQRDLFNGYNNIIYFFKEALIAEENKLLSLSPNEVLKRGYAFIKLRNKILKSIKEVEVNEEIEVSLTDGKLWCKILEKFEVE
ncbi:exodeoxyribonuclease VII large subunit [Anaerobranca gottschalkii]|uniref:Exodeoxyribonuclease 7 large subunit n=1 Tax=Anaerobranca gottschalkii DSM 13577 TaxID=1120990 RepID=A0A1H9Y1Z1_9FIRM|nr:exodeoxyribonuclease VII large subunit [Anaerobranca gottschalkii]SES62824.1 Exodeoxyribonuclease VII large subunit [Anaerobranca gottschalkii DSM 13577]